MYMYRRHYVPGYYMYMYMYMYCLIGSLKIE